MENSHKKKLSQTENLKLEIISIFILIAFALIFYFFTNIRKNNNSRKIVIFSNNIRISEIDGIKFNEIPSGTYTINDGNGGINTIEISDGKVQCVDSNCPDKICVSHGFLNPDIDNDMIICAPHKLIIQYN